MAQDDGRLEGATILSSATRELRHAIEAVAVRTNIRSGEILFSQGDPGNSFYVIERGEIEISVHSFDGRKLALDVLRDGEVFGEIALFGGNRTATATALSDCVLRRIRRSDVLSALRRESDLALDFIDVLCARLRAVSAKIEERFFLPVPVRLANRLLHLDAKLARPDGTLMVSQSELADFVGATRESTAKTLALWRSNNWIALSRGAVRIVDRAALESLADASQG